MATQPDDVDHRILDTLGRNGRMSMRELAEVVHISRANAYARVERLQSSGVIRGYRADIDPDGPHAVKSGNRFVEVERYFEIAGQ